MGHAENAFHDVLGSPTRLTTVDSAAERYLAPAHLDLDVRRVDVGVVVQLVADVLTDALVRALVAARTTAAMVGLTSSTLALVSE